MYLPLVLIGAISSVFGASCDSNQCYQPINNTQNSLTNLLQKFNQTVSQANVTKVFDVRILEKDIKEAEKLENKIKNVNKKLDTSDKTLKEVDLQISKDKKTVDDLLERVSNISKYNDTVIKILKEAKENQTELQKLLGLGENTSKTCKKARDKYKELENIIENVVKNYENVTKNYEKATTTANKLNKDVSDTFEDVASARQKFGQVALPIDLVEDYVIDAAKKINETLQYLKSNMDLMKDVLEGARKMWHDELESEFKKVAEYISLIQDDVDKMDEDLKNYESAFPALEFSPTVDEVSRDLLRQIREKIEDLENKFNSIKFSEEEILLLQDYTNDEKNRAEIRKKRKQLKEYIKILDSVPTSEEELREIKAIIKDLRDRVELFEEWKRLKAELEILRKNRDEIVKINCSNGNNTGLLT